MQPANPENPQPFEARYEDMETRSIADSDKEEPQGFSSRIEYHCITSKTPLEEAGSLYSVRESMAFRLAL